MGNQLELVEVGGDEALGRLIGIINDVFDFGILGPIFATALLACWPPLPYLICAVVLLVTTVLTVQRLCRDSQSAS